MVPVKKEVKRLWYFKFKFKWWKFRRNFGFVLIKFPAENELRETTKTIASRQDSCDKIPYESVQKLIENKNPGFNEIRDFFNI